MDGTLPNQTAPPTDGRGVLSALSIWLGTWLCCGLAIAYFYDLHSLKYPFESASQQIITAFRTALIATLVSSWVAWFAARRTRHVRTATLRTALASQAMLTLFALIGFQLAIRTENAAVDWVFPSTFFAEYNWLTFIFEVAPATSVAAIVLMYLFSRFSWEME